MGSCTCTTSKSAPMSSRSRRERMSTGSPMLATDPLSRTGKLRPSGITGTPSAGASGPAPAGGSRRGSGVTAAAPVVQQLQGQTVPATIERAHAFELGEIVGRDEHHRAMPLAPQRASKPGDVLVDRAR